MRHIIIVGNPVDGFQFFGPFRHHEDAIARVEQYAPGDTWQIATLYEPSQMEDML